MLDIARLFIASPFKPGGELVRLLRNGTSASAARGVLYKKLPAGFAFTGFSVCESLEDADFLLVPQAVRKVTSAWLAYWSGVRTQAENAGKKTIVFIGSDLSHTMHVPDASIVFKHSEYRHARLSNEIVAAPFVADLSEEIQCAPRKKSEKPVIGFCGYAGFPSALTYGKYLLKNIALDVASVFSPNTSVYKRGIYFRRKAMAALKGSIRIETKFTVRDSYGGNVSTMRISPEQARSEYLENMQDSDFVLAPKGDANFSSRFYEALSFGRIPILIDTDMILPLENVVDYSKFTLRIPHTDIYRLGDIVADFYNSLTNEQFEAMQKQAREAYEKHLRYDSYFNVAMPLLKSAGLEALR